MPTGDRPRRLRPATLAARAGAPAPAQGTPLGPQLTLAAPYHLSGDPAHAEYGYGRYDNPTWTAYERALGELERADALAFASGMAAVAAVLLPALKPGDVLVVPTDGYYVVRALAASHLAPRDVTVREVPTEEAAIRAALPGASLVWLESPTNPGMDVVDIAALAEAAHAEGALVAGGQHVRHPAGPGAAGPGRRRRDCSARPSEGDDRAQRAILDLGLRRPPRTPELLEQP